MQQIDFSALPETRWKSKLKKVALPTLFKLIISFLGILVLVFLVMALHQLFIAAFIIILVVAIIYDVKHSVALNRSFTRFATTNKWYTEVDTPAQESLEMMGYYFSRSSLSGSIDGVLFWLATMMPIGVKTKRSDPTDVLIFELPKPLPTLLISPTQGLHTNITPLRGLEELNLKRIKLEGDFDNLVRLYCVPGKEVDSLAYITPDVMQVLVDKVISTVLYIDNRVYMFTLSLNPPSRQRYQKVFSDAQYLIKEIIEKQK